MAVSDRMTTDALALAQTHVYTVCQTGKIITLIKANTKDEMGGILTETTQELHAFPIRYSPFDREIREKISWAENVSVIFYVAMLEITNLSLTSVGIKQYTNLRHNNKQFELAYVDYYLSFGDDFLYLIIGAKL